MITQFAIVLVERLMPLHLKALDWRSRGSAFTYLPLMMDATRDGVAMLFRKRSTERGALILTEDIARGTISGRARETTSSFSRRFQ